MLVLSPCDRALPGEVNVAQARRWQEEGALVVDVREVDEWDAGHALGALHLPLSQLAQRLGELPRDRQLLFICRSGNRSGMAAVMAQCAGFDRVSNVYGGMLAWMEADLPVEV